MCNQVPNREYRAHYLTAQFWKTPLHFHSPATTQVFCCRLFVVNVCVLNLFSFLCFMKWPHFQTHPPYHQLHFHSSTTQQVFFMSFRCEISTLSRSSHALLACRACWSTCLARATIRLKYAAQQPRRYFSVVCLSFLCAFSMLLNYSFFQNPYRKLSHVPKHQSPLRSSRTH